MRLTGLYLALAGLSILTSYETQGVAPNQSLVPRHGTGQALELAQHGIRVNAITPGDIQTDIIKDDHIKNLVKKPISPA